MPINITGSYKFKRSHRKKPAPLLPGDAVLLKQIEEEQAKKRAGKSVSKLENLGPAQIQWQKSRPVNLVELVQSVLDRMWVEVPENLTLSTKEQIRNARDIPPMIMTSHLYGIYAHNTTLVDRTLAACQKQRTLRVLDVNIPDVNEMVILSNNLDSPLKDILDQYPEARWFSKDQLKDHDVNKLVKDGYLTIDPTKPGIYSIAVPWQGAVIKLVVGCRRWLVKTLKTSKWKEMTEDQLETKLQKSSAYWKDYRGVSLEWILYDCVGSGLIEGFDTPIGRGWKLL